MNDFVKHAIQKVENICNLLLVGSRSMGTSNFSDKHYLCEDIKKEKEKNLITFSTRFPPNSLSTFPAYISRSPAAELWFYMSPGSISTTG